MKHSFSNNRTARFRAGRLVGLFLLVLAGILAPGTSEAQTTGSISKEYQIKAAFMFHFAEFVEWPVTNSTNTSEPFYIAIIGDDPFGDALEAIIKDETVNQRKLVVEHWRRIEDMKDCQMAFICPSEKARMTEILERLNARHILTVSEMDGFTRQGGIINFYLEGNKVRFEINPNAAQKEGLKISSQLLRLAKISESRSNFLRAFKWDIAARALTRPEFDLLLRRT